MKRYIAVLPIAAAILFGFAEESRAAVVPLTDTQAKTLQYMREEEKLARDVYQALYTKWNVAAFSSIAASEDTHYQTLGILLDRYSVADPAKDKPAGVYTNSELTHLYAELMAKGTASLKDAIEVGLLIDRTDIADLEKAIAAADRFDIKRVFTNLMNASYNHLEAFEANLELACRLNP